MVDFTFNKPYRTGIVNLALAPQSPQGENLAVIPDNWEQYAQYGRLMHGPDPQICFVDYDIVRTLGKPSIRIEPHTSADVNAAREVNATWLPVNGGDHIVAKCWMKTDFNGITDAGTGARIGIDFYGANGYIGGVSGPHGTLPQPGEDTIANYVPWGTVAWSQRTIEFDMPSIITIDENGKIIDPAQVPTNFVMWVQALPASAPGNAWFADAELYIGI